MPMYTWRDETTDYKIDVLRTVEERINEPTEEELPTKEQGRQRVWKRLIGAGIAVDYAQGSVKGRMGDA